MFPNFFLGRFVCYFVCYQELLSGKRRFALLAVRAAAARRVLAGSVFFEILAICISGFPIFRKKMLREFVCARRGDVSRERTSFAGVGAACPPRGIEAFCRRRSTWLA
jgi:hypothetical protein